MSRCRAIFVFRLPWVCAFGQPETWGYACWQAKQYVGEPPPLHCRQPENEICGEVATGEVKTMRQNNFQAALDANIQAA